MEKVTASDGRALATRGGAVRTSFIERSLASPVVGISLVRFAIAAAWRAGAHVYVLIGLCMQSEWENTTRLLCNASSAIM